MAMAGARSPAGRPVKGKGMEPKDKVRFFLLVLFFCGSVVLIAATDLTRIYRAKRGDPDAAKRLVEQLQGVHPPTRSSLRRDFDEETTLDQWKGKQYDVDRDNRSELRKLVDSLVSDEPPR